MNGFRQTIGDDIRVGRLFDSLAVLQHLDVLGQQFPVKGVRVVEIDSFTLFVRHSRRIVIVGVQRDDGCTVVGQHLGDLLDDGSLS